MYNSVCLFRARNHFFDGVNSSCVDIALVLVGLVRFGIRAVEPVEKFVRAKVDVERFVVEIVVFRRGLEREMVTRVAGAIHNKEIN